MKIFTKLFILIFSSIMLLSLTACKESKEDHIRSCVQLTNSVGAMMLFGLEPKKDGSLKQLYDCNIFLKTLSPEDRKIEAEIEAEIHKKMEKKLKKKEQRA